MSVCPPTMSKKVSEKKYFKWQKSLNFRIFLRRWRKCWSMTLLRNLAPARREMLSQVIDARDLTLYIFCDNISDCSSHFQTWIPGLESRDRVRFFSVNSWMITIVVDTLGLAASRMMWNVLLYNVFKMGPIFCFLGEYCIYRRLFKSGPIMIENNRK